MMLLLDKTLELVPEQTKTNCVFEFAVDQEFDSIMIDASYSPKYVEDPEVLERLTLEGSIKFGLVDPSVTHIDAADCPEIVNMICLSVDMNGQFCGYAHRHDPVQHIVISEGEASPGFYHRKPEKGMWKITLAVCLVATPVCTYHLRVSGE